MANFITNPQDNDFFLARIFGSTITNKIKFSVFFDYIKLKLGFVTETQNKFLRDDGQFITIETGGGGGGTETTTTIGALINGATAKTTPIDTDMVGLIDSTSSNILKKLSWANLKATLKSYFDTVYNNYIHPDTHPASVITQDTNNRFVTDTEKNTWNAKSNFSGAYNDLAGKPSLFDGNYNSLSNKPSLFNGDYNYLSNKPTIPTALSQLTEDSTHKHITEAEKANIPKNTSLIQDFSQAAITIDFTAYDIQEDDKFDMNAAITTGNKIITITNPFLNKVVTILLPKITEGTVFIFPAKCYKLTGDMSYTLQNVIMIHCIGTSPARYLYTISQIQA